MLLWLANCYFTHDSSGFPVLLPFFDAPSKSTAPCSHPKRLRKPGPKGPSAELIHAVWSNVIPTGAVRESPNRSPWRSTSKSTKTCFEGFSPITACRTGLRWSLLADFPGPHERQALEYWSIQVRVGHFAVPLGLGRHGSIHAPHHWVRRPCGKGRWCRTLSDVQPRHSRATLDAEVPQLRQRSTLSVPPVASPKRQLPRPRGLPKYADVSHHICLPEPRPVCRL